MASLTACWPMVPIRLRTIQWRCRRLEPDLRYWLMDRILRLTIRWRCRLRDQLWWAKFSANLTECDITGQQNQTSGAR
jgi:hypothetical protein